MALTISQMAAVAYNAVLAEARTPANQWAESSFMKELEAQGAIVREDLGPSIEAPLDYRRNPGGQFLATDLAAMSLTKTDVITAASYTPAQISVPVTWSKMDEVQTPSKNQKVAFTKSLLTNAFDSHDDLLEQYIFQTSTNGFLGLLTHVPTSGQGSDGGIDSATEAFWRCQSNTYVDDTDIEAGLQTTYNQCAKGSGAKLKPTLLASDAATWSLFAGTQMAMQRWSDGKINAGIQSLKFNNANYVFSQYASTSVFLLNAKNFSLVASKQYFRDRGDTQELPNANGYRFFVYSALQTIVNNRSRLGVLHL